MKKTLSEILVAIDRDKSAKGVYDLLRLGRVEGVNTADVYAIDGVYYATCRLADGYSVTGTSNGRTKAIRNAVERALVVTNQKQP